jgi:hypothetical protein
VSNVTADLTAVEDIRVSDYAGPGWIAPTKEQFDHTVRTGE